MTRHRDCVEHFVDGHGLANGRYRRPNQGSTVHMHAVGVGLRGTARSAFHSDSRISGHDYACGYCAGVASAWQCPGIGEFGVPVRRTSTPTTRTKKNSPKKKADSDRDTIRDEYDCSKGVRGLTAERYAEG